MSDVVVLGLGASGEAAATLLMRQGASVTIVDRGDNDTLRDRASRLEREGMAVRLACDALPEGSFDLAVVSPGVADGSPWVQELKGRGVPIISELALGGEQARCPMIAVTGSKGKSTLVKLTAESLACAGLRVAIAGNYGPPLCAVVEQSEQLDWLVVEVSSFQMEFPGTFHPRVGVLLNVQPDHLDRHGTLEAYREIKSRVFRCMQVSDTALVHDVDRDAVAAVRSGIAAWTTFGCSETADYRYEADGIHSQGEGGPAVVSVAGTGFANEILGQAVAACVAVVDACGQDPACVRQAIRSFQPLPHRMQEVGRAGDVVFVNDSKATSLTALSAGLKMCDRPVRLIAGGRLKETDLNLPKEMLERKVRTAYLIGEAASGMCAAWSDVIRCRTCESLEAALLEVRDEAQQGEVVLFSPGCASFDQFKNFEDRGNQFVENVVGHINTEAAGENNDRE